MIGQRLKPLRKRADILGVIKLLNVLTRPGNGHAIKQFKEIKVECIKDRLRGPFLGLHLGPDIENPLSASKYLINVFFGS